MPRILDWMKPFGQARMPVALRRRGHVPLRPNYECAHFTIPIRFSHWRLLFVGLLSLLLAGCGGKGSTKLSYTAPIAPFGISFSVDKDGSWSVAAGLATPIGTFAIEHTFESRDGFTYIILRNRDKGTDQVFKIGNTGYVDLHAIGEHKIRMWREDNRWIIDTQTISGTLEVKVYPSNSAIARVDFGKEAPDVVVTNDRRLIIEYPSVFTSSKTVPLDSVQSITLQRRIILNSQWLSFEWKKGVHEEPLDIWFPDSGETQSNFDALQKSVGSIAPHVSFGQRKMYLTSALIIASMIISFAVGMVPGYEEGKGSTSELELLGFIIFFLFLGFVVVCLGSLPPLVAGFLGIIVGFAAGLVRKAFA